MDAERASVNLTWHVEFQADNALGVAMAHITQTFARLMILMDMTITISIMNTTRFLNVVQMYLS